MYLTHNWRRWLAVLGTTGLTVLGSTPAQASVAVCTQTGVQWAPVQQISLGPDRAADGSFIMDGVWSAPVSITVYCKDSGTTEPLQGAVFSVSAYSKDLTDLLVTIDGTDPRVPHTPALAPLPLPVRSTTGRIVNDGQTLGGNLVSDATGTVTFNLRAYSTNHPILSPTGESTQVGLDFQAAISTPLPDGTPGFLDMGSHGQIFAATPELDSLVLFGGGASSLAAYAMMRMRARRRDQPRH